MKYINSQNGAVIDTTSKLGGAWVAQTATQAKAEKAPSKKETKRTEK